MRERPDLPLFTIHDPVGTTPEHAEYVRGVVMREFAALGLSPTLKREIYQ
jgi:hypothetical protein